MAGLGTRLLPATRSAPKEMLPVVDKPVVQYVVEELADAGVTRVLLVTGRRKRAIEDHFDGDPTLGLNPIPGDGLQLLYTRQSRPAGLGDAVAHGEGFAGGGGDVVVALGDAIIESPAAGSRPGIVARLIEAHERHSASATLAVTEVATEEVANYGIALGSPLAEGVLEVSRLVEKPAAGSVDSRLAVAARYVLGPDVFTALRDVTPDARGEIQLTDAIQAVIDGGGRVLAVPLRAGERRHDIGTVEGYCSTFLDHALRHPVLGERLRAHAAAVLDER
ncbi:MAG: UTP--glucose-1-phosphate uridylyltransferase [Solirubrobacteraceae bacterium]